MASRKKKVKLTKNDIGDSSKNISHSISKIKANECKYTFVFVIIFLCLFGVIGYFALSIDSTGLLNGIKGASTFVGFSSSSTMVTLNSNNVMSDEDGLKSTPYVIRLSNHFDYSYDYQLKLDEDTIIKGICDCTNSIDKSLIRYSLDGVNVQTIDNDNLIISFGSIEEASDKELNVRIWLNSESNIDENSHFHGIFNFSEVGLIGNN